MKIEIGRITSEGFTGAFALRFGDLVLRTNGSMLFLSGPQKDSIRKQFSDFVSELESLGVQFEGKEKIDML